MLGLGGSWAWASSDAGEEAGTVLVTSCTKLSGSITFRTEKLFNRTREVNEALRN